MIGRHAHGRLRKRLTLCSLDSALPIGHDVRRRFLAKLFKEG